MKYYDKILHILFSFIISGLIGTTLILANYTTTPALLSAVYAGECVGITKEWCDWLYRTAGGTGWSWGDFIADQIGILLAIIWIYLLTII